MCSGARGPGSPEQSSLLLGALCSSFLQEAPGRPLKGFDVIYVDEASPELQSSLVLKPPESPGHRLPVGPDHGAKVLVGVTSGYADLPRDLHPLALDEKEDEASKPRWHPF